MTPDPTRDDVVGAGDRAAEDRAPAAASPRRPGGAARADGLPPLGRLLAPIVVGLLAAGGFAWDRHAHRPPEWCGRIVPTLEVMAEIGTEPATPEEAAALADAAQDVDFDALVAALPPDLQGELRGRDEQWTRFVDGTAGLRPGGTLFQVVPLGLTGALTSLGERRTQDCEAL